MVFNADKCKLSNFEHGYKNVSNEMGGVLLESVNEERDLRVIIQTLKVDKQHAKAVKTANSVFGMIKKVI